LLAVQVRAIEGPQKRQSVESLAPVVGEEGAALTGGREGGKERREGGRERREKGFLSC
jgi:hypothetical protein